MFRFHKLAVTLLLLTTCSPLAHAESIYLATSTAWPGTLLERTTSGELHELFRRDRRAEVPRLAQIAPATGGVFYYCTGLDGRIYELRSGRERLVYESRHQVRDLAFAGGTGTLFFSTVDTPQNGAPLAAGHIFRLNVHTADAQLEHTVRQVDVGHGWWGTFTLDGNSFLLGTMERGDSHVYRARGRYDVEVVLNTHERSVHGLAVASSGQIYYVANDGCIYRGDGATVNLNDDLRGARLSDVSFAAPGLADRLRETPPALPGRLLGAPLRP